ncbi:MAG: HAMP domain-containing histidine kinase [Leptospira sp.]|nr:HAMP domain-containing histidine kinase [Leptospira sp.]
MRKAEKGKTYRINYRSKNKKGDFIHLENTSQVLEFNNQGSAKKILNSIRDRTDYFKYLELTNQSVKKTRSISEAKTKFLANISHELKTPLNSILGYSEFLQMPGMSPLSEQQKLYIETIHKDGQYLLNLMNQILDYSKTEMNKFQIHLTKTNLNSLLSEIVNSFLIITQEKEVIILFNDDANVPRIEIDPIRMREVISNLINNAIKFSDPGMEIAVHLHEDLENIYISISDQGIGIQQKDLEKIFEPFEQIQTEKSVKNDGIGLGLSLSKKIVEMHKGKLTVESKIGKGSCFTICLPRPYQLK